MVMALDVEAMRRDFPALQSPFIHLDGTGGTQVPRAVAKSLESTLSLSMSHRGTRTAAERAADHAVRSARSAVADLVGAEAEGVIFGRSMTELTFNLARTVAREWRVGDEIVLCRLDHGANITPWIIEAERAGCTVRWIEFDPESTEVSVEDVTAVLSDRTRLVAMTGASNLVGSRPPLEAISRAVHRVGALLYVDGVHLAPHAPIDVAALGADFFALSTHKLFGPHCAAVVASPPLLEGLRPDKLPSTPNSVPERFELGTAAYEVLAGVAATVDYIAGLSGAAAGDRRLRVVRAMELVEEHESRLRARLDDQLGALPGLRVHSRASLRTPTALVSVEGAPPAALAEYLASCGIGISVGIFNCSEASRVLGLGDDGAVRIGLVAYNNEEEVDVVAEAVASYLRTRAS